MKHLLMILLTGFALTACSTPTPEETMDPQTEMTPEEKSEVKDASMTYVEEMGFTEIKNVNGTNPYDTYMLSEAEAADPMVYNQWMYTWVEPVNYVDKEIMVYEYTGMKDDKNYNIYTLVSSDEVVGGYYFEEGTDVADMKNAMILHTENKASTEEDFMTNWNKTFNINNESGTDSNTDMNTNTEKEDMK